MSDNTNTEVEIYSGNDIAAAIAALQDGGTAGIYSSMPVGSQEDGLAVFNAVTNSSPLADKLNTPIKVQHVIVQEVSLLNEQTGEMSPQPRVTLVTDKGEAYHVTSAVALRSLRTLFAFIGTPDRWEKPVELKAVRGGSGTRQFIEIRRA